MAPNAKQQYVIDLIESWGGGMERDNEIVIAKDFRRLTIKSINYAPSVKRRLMELTETGLVALGDYDTNDRNWKIKALNDIGAIDAGFLDDVVLTHFLNKRMFGGK